MEIEKYWIEDYRTALHEKKKEREVLILELATTGYGDIIQGLLSCYLIARVTNRKLYVRRSSKVSIDNLFDDTVLKQFVYEIEGWLFEGHGCETDENGR